MADRSIIAEMISAMVNDSDSGSAKDNAEITGNIIADKINLSGIGSTGISGVPVTVSYMDAAIVPILESIARQLRPKTKEQREEEYAKITGSIVDALEIFHNKNIATTLRVKGAMSGSGGDDRSGEGGFIKDVLGAFNLGGNFIRGILGIGALSLALVGFAFSLKKLMEVVGLDFSTLLLSTVAIGGFFLLIRQIGKDFSKVLKGSLGFAAIAGTLVLFSIALAKFAPIDFKSVALGALAIGGLFKIVEIIGRKFSTVMKGNIALAGIGLALIPFAKAMQMMTKVNFKAVGVLAASLITVGLAVAALTATIASGVGGLAVAGAIAALAGIGVALIPLAYALDLFGEASKKFVPLFKTFGEVIKGVIGKIGDTFTDILESVEEFSNNVNVDNLTDAAVGIGAIATALAAFAGGDFLSSALSVGSSLLDFFTGRVGNVELLGILTLFGESAPQLAKTNLQIERLASNLSNMAGGFTGESIDNLLTLLEALRSEIQVTEGFLGRVAGFVFGGDVTALSALIKLAEISPDIDIFSKAILGLTEALAGLNFETSVFNAQKSLDGFVDYVIDNENDINRAAEILNQLGNENAAAVALQLDAARAEAVAAEIGAGFDQVASSISVINQTAPTQINNNVSTSLSASTNDIELAHIVGHGSVLS